MAAASSIYTELARLATIFVKIRGKLDSAPGTFCLNHDRINIMMREGTSISTGFLLVELVNHRRQERRRVLYEDDSGEPAEYGSHQSAAACLTILRKLLPLEGLAVI